MWYSAVNTWKDNRYHNTFETADPTDFEELLSWQDKDISEIHGIVPIPVCSFLDAYAAAAEDPNNEAGNQFWPCPASGASG